MRPVSGIMPSDVRHALLIVERELKAAGFESAVSSRPYVDPDEEHGREYVLVSAGIHVPLSPDRYLALVSTISTRLRQLKLLAPAGRVMVDLRPEW